MKVELLKTLKSGNNIWKKGLILNDELVPLPDGILRELAVRAKTVKVISSKPIPHIQEETEISEPPKKLTRTDISRMNKYALTVFIGDEIQTMGKTRRELIEIAMEKINDKS